MQSLGRRPSKEEEDKENKEHVQTTLKSLDTSSSELSPWKRKGRK